MTEVRGQAQTNWDEACLTERMDGWMEGREEKMAEQMEVFGEGTEHFHYRRVC